MWHVSSRSSVATLQTAIHLLLTYLLTQVVLEKRPLNGCRVGVVTLNREGILKTDDVAS